LCFAHGLSCLLFQGHFPQHREISKSGARPTHEQCDAIRSFYFSDRQPQLNEKVLLYHVWPLPKDEYGVGVMMRCYHCGHHMQVVKSGLTKIQAMTDHLFGRKKGAAAKPTSACLGRPFRTPFHEDALEAERILLAILSRARQLPLTDTSFITPMLAHVPSDGFRNASHSSTHSNEFSKHTLALATITAVLCPLLRLPIRTPPLHIALNNLV